MVRQVLAVCLIALASVAAAVEPDEILDDPALEARARDISRDIRCVVCQNEPIDSSNAGVARDLRILIRERLVAGDSDAEVVQYLVDRYGDYVLFKPPFKPTTYALWLAPFALLGLGGVAAASALRRRKAGTAPEGLSPEDEAKVGELMARFDAEMDKKDT
ncbi:cytochrome c-type biogenesis protein CcmH [Marinovum sp. 2_MG-2023]|uniref:cytochrome c-type biogenesis protein n=1 Tax=Marinovum sp. 2_MG-2023 TaxID=3062637 RepID=UPI0026E1D7B7|nr:MULTISPECIES: cytochrome c-type biogenesis protein [unclassified Marinovum]MDO6729375.1 cytochrome c-type biogenesis protein CcmH [Marinovum sp. 2_MG-2023]MDO6780409.1 cytochrome c-type biogenesis protein CcmH [Marinovum sp. 1_MG-2023]